MAHHKGKEVLKDMKKLFALAILLSLFLIPSHGSATFYLHGTGANDNPPALFLGDTAPTATAAKYRDSAGVKFSGGNVWKEIGTWTITTTGTLTELHNLHLWLGLKNSDDIGTRFDLRAEFYRNGQFLVASGELYCVQNITRNPDLAKEVVVSFGSFSPVNFSGADILSLKILTRIGTNGAGAFCGGHSNAVGLRLYFDAISRPSRFDATLSENSPPVAQDQRVTTDEDVAKAITLVATDPDGDQLTYQIMTQPGYGTLSGTPPSVTYTPTAHFYGSDSFTFKANDGKIDSNEATVSITVTHVNHPPVAQDQSVITDEDMARTITLVATDPDGDPLTYQIVT